MNIVIIGLTITSSWGNGHATTYRSLIRELARRGHQVLFLERDMPWYASNRDFTEWPYATVRLYQSQEELKSAYGNAIRDADAVIVGSYVPEGIEVGKRVLDMAEGPVAFYDIDTPVTLAQVEAGSCDYLERGLIARYRLYLSFAGGRTLRRLEDEFGSPRAEAFYCSADPELYYPENQPEKWDMGYLGTYSADRQPAVDRLLVEPARRWPEGRFVLAGPQYPADLDWPENVGRIEHSPPSEHRGFYNRQRFTLNVTRVDMVTAGHSPSVRLFEAAACGTPVISDRWDGLEEFFEFGTEILVADTSEEALRLLRETPPERAKEIGRAARARVLAAHTAAHRAEELERHLERLIRENPQPASK